MSSSTRAWTRIRLTGGGPLLRRDVPTLVERLATRSRIADLALTTNGVFLADRARALRAAGLHRVTVSLDTPLPAQSLSRPRPIRQAQSRARGHRGGGTRVRDTQDRHRGHSRRQRGRTHQSRRVWARVQRRRLRFIEYMDVDQGATQWSMAHVVSKVEMLETLARHYGPIVPCPKTPRRRRAAISSRTALSLASSRPPRSRSAVTATAAGSRPTACGTSVCMPRAAWTFGSCCARGRQRAGLVS